MKRYLFLIITCSCLWRSATCQEISEKGKKAVLTAVDSIGVPSMSASVYKNGVLVFNFAYGVKDIVSKLPVTSDDPYHIGSVTKSVTATMIGYLVEENKLAWNTRIIDIFPSLDSLKTDYTQASLVDLLSHSSGLVDLFKAEDWRKIPYDTTQKDKQRIDLMIKSLINKQNGKRGQEWAYANVNYTIASLMASQVTNLSWEKLMQIYIADKVGISFGYGWAEDTATKMVPKGHVKFSEEYEVWGPNHPHKIPVTIRAAGDIYMKVSDLAKYGYFHIMGLQGQIKGLSQENFIILHKPILENYALGWNIIPDGTRSLPDIEQHQHLGSGGTFHSVIAIFPEKNVSIAIIHNGGGNILPISYVLTKLGDIFNSEK